MTPPLVVTPNRYTPGADTVTDAGRLARVDGTPLEGLPLASGAQAWGQTYPTDAHCVAYVVPGWPMGTPHPRINKGALAGLVALGACPLVHWAIVDLDNEGHTAWTKPDQDTLDRIVAQVDDAGLDDAGVYLTRSGYRLVWELAEPLPAGDVAEATLAAFLDHLERAGFAPDRACSDWTRLYRMPQATRDGELVDLPRRMPFCH